MIRTRLDLAGDRALVNASGIAYLQFRNTSGSVLRVAPGTIFSWSAPASATQANLFVQTNNGWLLPTDTTNRVNYNSQAQRFDFETRVTNWLAAGTSLPVDANKQLQITTPTNFGNSNTLVYVMADGGQWVRRANGRFSDRRFELVGLPASNSFRIVALSLLNGQYHWSNTVINPISASVQNASISFNPVSLSELLQALSSL
jgi:hypothetical protein